LATPEQLSAFEGHRPGSLKCPDFRQKMPISGDFHASEFRGFSKFPLPSFFRKSGIFSQKTPVFWGFSMIFPEKSGVALI
jgi:hypothetical protein